MSGTWTLYIGRDRSDASKNDLGSVLCYSVVRRLPSSSVHVVNGTDIPPRDRPIWLRGTPTLFHESSHTVLTGFEALERLHDLLAERRSSSRTSGAGTFDRSPGIAYETAARLSAEEFAEEGRPSLASHQGDTLSSGHQPLAFDGPQDGDVTPDDMLPAARGRGMDGPTGLAEDLLPTLSGLNSEAADGDEGEGTRKLGAGDFQRALERMQKSSAGRDSRVPPQ